MAVETGSKLSIAGARLVGATTAYAVPMRGPVPYAVDVMIASPVDVLTCAVVVP